MAEFALVTMLVALVLYVVFGGADFGAGIVELLAPEEEEHVDHAIAPVWEANHVWLILVVVIAFVAFPRVYSTVSTYLHVPLALALVGIIARGAAFTFRHYDPDPGSARKAYGALFRWASVFTPICLGATLGACISGDLTTDLSRGFAAVFLRPWLSPFALAVGLFATVLFTFLATVLLSAEHARRGRLPHRRRARNASLATIAAGALVFATAGWQDVPLAADFVGSNAALACLAGATLLVPVVARSFSTARIAALRVALVAQVGLIMTGFFVSHWPVFVRLSDAPNLEFANTQAPDPTMQALGVALVIGLVTILPAMAWLIVVYKRGPHDAAG